MTKVMGGRDYKNFRAHNREVQTSMKEREKAESERVKDLKDTLGDVVPQFNDPIPQNYVTFDQWRKYYHVHKPNPYAKKGKR